MWKLSLRFNDSRIEFRSKDILGKNKTNAIEDFVDGVYIVRNVRQVIFSEVNSKVRHYFRDKVQTSKRFSWKMVDIGVQRILPNCFIKVNEIPFTKSTWLFCNLSVQVDILVSPHYLFSDKMTRNRTCCFRYFYSWSLFSILIIISLCFHLYFYFTLEIKMKFRGRLSFMNTFVLLLNSFIFGWIWCWPELFSSYCWSDFFAHVFANNFECLDNNLKICGC